MPLLFAAVLPLIGCGTPTEGPQLTRLPDGTMYQQSAYREELLLPANRRVRQSGYTVLAPPYGEIMLTEYSGSATPEEMEASRRAFIARLETAHRRYSKTPLGVRFGTAENLEIDDRPAKGWFDAFLSQGSVSTTRYTAIVPYDDRTFTVEIDGGYDPPRSDEQLRSLATSFLIGRKGKSDIWVIGLVLIAAAVLIRFIQRIRKEAPRA